jgi:hypothetical protein
MISQCSDTDSGAVLLIITAKQIRTLSMMPSASAVAEGFLPRSRFKRSGQRPPFTKQQIQIPHEAQHRSQIPVRRGGTLTTALCTKRQNSYSWLLVFIKASSSHVQFRFHKMRRVLHNSFLKPYQHNLPNSEISLSHGPLDTYLCRHPCVALSLKFVFTSSMLFIAFTCFRTGKVENCMPS